MIERMCLFLFDQCLVGIPHAPSVIDFLKTGASLLALPLAGFTFWLGYRQKEKERLSSYYHKAVIDVVLPSILQQFAEEIEHLNESGRIALEGAQSTRKTIPKSCNVALSAFSDNIFRLQDSIIERTLIFDERLSADISIEFQETQDDITQWFSDVALHKRRERHEITQILRTRQRRIIRRLYRADFADFREHWWPQLVRSIRQKNIR